MSKRLRLRGKHAVGEHEFARIDDDMAAELLRHRWKAKPNAGGNNVYAVRNAKVGEKWVTIRMHRVVLGLAPDDPRDVDHINHNGLDNRRANLRAVSRSENISNARMVEREGNCQRCGQPVRKVMKATCCNALVCDTCRR